MSRPADPAAPALLELLDAGDDALFLLDGEGRFAYVNRPAARLAGMEPEELLGLVLERDLGGRFSPRWPAARAHARRTGQPTEYESHSPLTGGWVRVRVVPCGDTLAVQLRDVTALRRAEALQSLGAALAEARTSAGVLEALLRGVVVAAGAVGGQVVDGAEAGRPPRATTGEAVPAPELAARVQQTGQPAFQTGVSTGEASVTADPVAAHPVPLAALPLCVDDGVWGVLVLTFAAGEQRGFAAPEQAFLDALAQQGAQALGRVLAEGRLARQAEVLDALGRVGPSVAAELDLERLMQAVTDAGVALSGADYGALFYNPSGAESFPLYALSGAPREAFAAFPAPRPTQVFGPTLTGQAVVRSGDITRDPRFGHNAPYRGLPPGHLAVRSYLGVPVVSRSGTVLGGLFFGHAEPDRFDERAEQLLVGLAAQAAVALDNARLYQELHEERARLGARVAERTHELAEQAAALGAFVRFTEAVGTRTDVSSLAQEALGVFRSFFVECSAAYYEREGELWRARVWTTDIAPEVVASITGGVPLDAPAFAEAERTREPVFVDGWNAGEQQVAATEDYGTVALYPLAVGAEVPGMLAVGLKTEGQWSERGRAIVRSAGRSLALSLERADSARQLAAQRDALAARTRALEAFADLSRDLTLEADAGVLIRRAQEIVLSLLPGGYSVYWEPEGERWVKRSQVGDLRSETLQRELDAGLPLRETPTMWVPLQTGEPLYQDTYDGDRDGLGDQVNHIAAVASLPVRVGDAVRGVIVVGLFGGRSWTGTDRAVLDTVARSLSLTLEGADKARALQRRTEDLERSNAELERFAYVASHDLQEPLRTIASFTELIVKRHAHSLDPQGQRYLDFVVKGAERMKSLIDDLLVFSRLNAVQEPLVPVPSREPLAEALARLHGAVEAAGARVVTGELPTVLGAPGELTQLLQNLIGNAVKFRREGAVPVVEVGAVRQGDEWLFTVRDNGIGFEPQYAERVFQMFQRLHLREHYEGTGMGLAIVRKIVQRHGGRVWAEGEPGQGSAFHFTLRAAGAGEQE
ncbi:GAF domain-containing protein [Deinococcus sp. MIMF12]|uniref:histidine kinase n=1 Tax=Deinococcus rhizophilus TaxID=3049544 RepID=A0ABT7JIA6_9DEIO|nr:GAF domain-containing protein [Deinococcus rhizophilus]MDL2344797.1 GAF domain-containing protein [Deinococcus rhizophilus]